MEHLLLLLLFWPWCSYCCFLLFGSLLHCLCGIFCPFKNAFSQRCPQLVWWAQLCPVMGLLDPGLFPAGILAEIPSYAWNLLWEVNFYFFLFLNILFCTMKQSWQKYNMAWLCWADHSPSWSPPGPKDGRIKSTFLITGG